MARGKIKFGNKGLELSLKKFEENMIEDVKKVIASTAAIIHSTATTLAPVDEGNLKQSIEIQFLKGGLTAVVTVNSSYAVWIEYGTGVYSKDGRGRKTPWVYWSDKLQRFTVTQGMPAQPFWGPAIDLGARHFHREMRRLGL